MKTRRQLSVVTGLLSLAAILALGTPAAQAQGYGDGYRSAYHCGPQRGYYGGGSSYYGGGSGYYGASTYSGGYGGSYPAGSGYGGGYAPTGYSTPTQYYGNGGHDLAPHWHNTQTPAGSFNWYGNGAHDLQPHEHTNSPYGGYRGYSPSPFGGVTTSYYNSTPYTYVPW